MPAKINSFIRSHSRELYILLIIVLVVFLAFGLGRLSAIYEEKGELKILNPDGQEAAAALPLIALGGQYVASKTGTQYYFPWCGSAARIAEVNRIYFATRAEAERAGYAAGNCSGMR